eukprot:2470652-Pleurochrysis_carterae.AAC.1
MNVANGCDLYRVNTECYHQVRVRKTAKTEAQSGLTTKYEKPAVKLTGRDLDVKINIDLNASQLSRPLLNTATSRAAHVWNGWQKTTCQASPRLLIALRNVRCTHPLSSTK